MDQEVIVANIVKCFLSALSLTASSTIVHMIRNSSRGFKSSHSRIIFGVSVGDILQSCGIFLGPFAVPKDTPDSPMAFGTFTTCDFTGFLTLSGSTTSVLYLLFLIFFFWRRVQHRVSPQKFAYGEERYLHVSIWIISLTFPSLVLAKKGFNPTRKGTLCILGSYPNGCGGNVEDENYIECTRGQDISIVSMFTGGLIVACLLLLFLLLASITCHVYSIERSLSSPNNNPQSNNTNAPDAIAQQSSSNDTLQGRIDDDPFPDNDGDEAAIIANQVEKKQSLTRRAANQSLLYIIAFIIVFIAPFSFLTTPQVEGSPYRRWILWHTSTLLPIFGIFLILIYTRPKVKIMSEMFPEASWLLCFWTVIISGGEVPPPHELRQPSVQDLPQMSGNREGLSSESTNGVYYAGLRSSMIAASRCEGWYVEIDDSDLSM